MKQLTLLTALLFTLGLGVPALAQEVYDEPYEYDLWDEDDIAAFDSDNWAEDDYGVYDEDFDWETDAEDWNDWSEEAHQDWSGYDDAGDEGWFDV